MNTTFIWQNNITVNSTLSFCLLCLQLLVLIDAFLVYIFKYKDFVFPQLVCWREGLQHCEGALMYLSPV